MTQILIYCNKFCKCSSRGRVQTTFISISHAKSPLALKFHPLYWVVIEVDFWQTLKTIVQIERYFCTKCAADLGLCRPATTATGCAIVVAIAGRPQLIDTPQGTDSCVKSFLVKNCWKSKNDHNLLFEFYWFSNQNSDAFFGSYTWNFWQDRIKIGLVVCLHITNCVQSSKPKCHKSN